MPTPTCRHAETKKQRTWGQSIGPGVKVGFFAFSDFNHQHLLAPAINEATAISTAPSPRRDGEYKTPERQKANFDPVADRSKSKKPTLTPSPARDLNGRRAQGYNEAPGSNFDCAKGEAVRNFMLLITAFLLVGLPALAAAQAPAPDNDKPQGDSRPTEIADEVTRLVRQLDDRELAKRQEAEQQLIALGADVLPLLPPPNNRMPAEMRQRLARIAGALEEAAARAVTESSKVTLSGTLPLAEAMAALEQQTGNHAVGYDQRDAEVTLDLNNVPYWQALDHILDQAQLNIDAYGGQPQTLVLMPRGPNELSRSQYADYHESFRVAAVRVLATRDFVNPAVQGMRISIAAAWEPRLAPISITQLLDKIEARDDQGNAITTDDTTGRREAPVHPGMSAVELELPLALPPRGAEKIATLKGELAVLVPGRVETFEFGGRLAEARNVEQRRAGVTVVLEEIRKNVDLHQIRVRIRFDEAAEALESHRGWIFNNEAYLLDAQGQRVDNVGLETTRQQRNEVGVAYLFDAPQGLAGHKFVYKTPALIIQMAVPYALKDLPLP